jgi:hypothetical protein
MSKEMTVVALGVWVIIIPYVGVPGSWRTTILILTGLAVILVGFLLRSQALSHGPKPTAHHPFIENLPDRQAGSASAAEPSSLDHDRKERITSLN